MVVELISVGTELLLGNIVNTNAAYLSEKCAGLGLSCFYQSVVGDNEKRLIHTIETALTRSDIVILSGGLGPTEDDLTKDAAAGVFGKEMRVDEDAREHIQEYFEKKGMEIAANNWKQAMVPEESVVLINENGTAPGFIMEQKGKVMILLPGPPNEMIPMFEKNIIPYLSRKTNSIIYSQVVKLCGISESAAEEKLADMVKSENPTVATYAKTGEVHIRVTAKEEDEKGAKKLIKPVVKELKNRFGTAVYSTDTDTTLEQSIVELLSENHLTITTAESCTGGMVAARIVNVPGASEIFKEGFITYSNKAKRRYLGVKKRTLDKYGAVSEQTAKEMAKGGILFTKSDLCIAVTGIAGPDGGTVEKPVGLVYISCAFGGKTYVEKCCFTGNRMKIRENTAVEALVFLRMCVLQHYNKMNS
ncbi:MAG TPA: competence/damage-inducible protein A [Lachnospiraceae bacterium]|nr:competence/damage-inducible protein A [Lachnospiraceae bacterium]